MKILFFGLGSIGTRHANIIKKLYPNYQIFAYRANKNQDNDSKLPYVTCFDNIDEAYFIKPDIVFVTSPTSLHIKSAIVAANNNCHLFIEKPLSNNKEGIEELISIVNNKNLITLMGCNMRFHPIILRIKEILEEPKFGRIFKFQVNCASYLPEWRPWQDYSKSYSAKKDLGGGVLLDLIHEIDYSQWLFGNFIEIIGRKAKISNLKIETEDFAELLIKTHKNIYGNIQLDYFSVKPERSVTVIFEKAVVKGDLIENSISIFYNNKETIENFNIDKNYTYEKQMEYFVECVKVKEKTFNDISEGYKVLKYILDI